MAERINEEVLAAHIEKLLVKDGPVITSLCAAFPQLLAIYAFGVSLNSMR